VHESLHPIPPPLYRPIVDVNNIRVHNEASTNPLYSMYLYRIITIPIDTRAKSQFIANIMARQRIPPIPEINLRIMLQVIYLPIMKEY
jgi:hypothetical protein